MSDIGSMLADTAERLFALHADAIEQAHAAGSWPAAAWDAVEDSGLLLALVPEDAGGFGLPAEEALALIRQTGRHALALPLAETVIANAALAAAGLPLSAGPAGLAESEQARVPWGRFAQTVLVSTDGALRRYGPLATAQKNTNTAGQPRDILAFGGESETAEHAGPSLRELGALARSLQMAGALERVLELTVDHVSTRVQFGRPLAKFQAIQQELAKLAGEVAAASAAADHAADAFTGGTGLGLAVAVARARIGEAAGKTTSIAHQLHGAIGFTQEHVLHRYTTALWAWRDEFGTQRHWTLRVGEHALGASRDDFWPMVVAA